MTLVSTPLSLNIRSPWGICRCCLPVYLRLVFFLTTSTKYVFYGKSFDKSPKTPVLKNFMNSIVSLSCHLRHGNDLHHVPSRASVHQDRCKMLSDAPLPWSPVLRSTWDHKPTSSHRGHFIYWNHTVSLSGKADTHEHTVAWGHNNSRTHNLL